MVLSLSQQTFSFFSSSNQSLPGHLKTDLFILTNCSKCYTVPRDETTVPLCANACKRSHTQVKDPVVHVRVWWIMEHQNSTACTNTISNSVKSLQNVGVGLYCRRTKISILKNSGYIFRATVGCEDEEEKLTHLVK